MKLSQALSIVAGAAEFRAELWAEAAGGYITGSSCLNCFEEADKEECLSMERLLTEAVGVIIEFRENFRSHIDEVEDVMENCSE